LREKLSRRFRVFFFFFFSVPLPPLDFLLLLGNAAFREKTVYISS
jgi:hypothetical protein